MKHDDAGRIEETFELSPEEEADLEAAIAEADAGLLVHSRTCFGGFMTFL